jgi:hypothetical protein
LDHHISIVATAFRVAGVVLGLPALIALVCLLWAWVSLHSGAPVPDQAATSISRDGLVGLLMAGARVLTKGFGAFAAMTSWAIVVLAVVALAATILGALLFFTGRGLAIHAAWARIVGSLLSLGLLALALGMLVFLRRPLALVAAAPLGASLYSLWALIRRFA